MTLQEIKAELEGYKLEDMDIETLMVTSRQANNYCINLHRSGDPAGNREAPRGAENHQIQSYQGWCDE